jgi:uncharacterized membrane protein ArfC
MAHVHWLLVAVSFALGLLLTSVLILRAVKTEAPVRSSGVRMGRVSETPTTKIATGGSSPPAGVPADGGEWEYPTTKIPVAQEFPTTKIPVAQDSPTTKIGSVQDFPTTKIPVTNEPAPPRPETDAPTTKIPVAEEAPTAKTKAVPYAPFGYGSARAGVDGAGPSGWLVKGRTDTRRYYTPEDEPYEQIVAQVWFKDEQAAARALFTAWSKSSNKG